MANPSLPVVAPLSRCPSLTLTEWVGLLVVATERGWSGDTYV